MILDSSALVAVIMAEPGWEVLFDKMQGSGFSAIGAPTLLESLMVLRRRLSRDPQLRVFELLAALNVEVIPFREDHLHVAYEAFLKYGKGRHRAALNFGDCISYAVARVARQPLLFVGGDFSLTDIAAV
jgi:ribonuclease VapC